jgi:2-polyprenyl-6-methoxyphenol hydroxylase-like FAD-dependent oxidoreductase
MLSKNILVVGAGPVGLAAALFLRKQGLKPRIIEKSTESTIYSKALAINPRSLDILSRVGITEHLLKEGVPVRKMRMYYQEKQLIEQRLDEVEIPGNKYPFLLVLPQSRTEAILRDALK